MKAAYTILLHGVGVIGLLVPIYALFHLAYFVLSLPLRRQERARFFLDLIESGLQQGRSAEHTITSISQTRDHSVGVRFHLLAAHLETGWRLPQALEKVPGLLPPQILAMFKVGNEIGDLKRILPACRTLLKDASSQTQSFHNYLVVLAFVLIPVIPALFWLTGVAVAPKLQMIFTEMTAGENVPSLAVFSGAAVVAQIQLLLAFLFYAGAVFYVGGPRLVSWLQAGFPALCFDWIAYRTPWRRKRLQRDFSAMLGVLLDAGVPEERAVRLAAESTANLAFLRRAERVAASLRQGTKLTDALQHLDETGEFRWRLANAARSGKNFFAALEGWLEALDAKAFQQQQATAQVVTTLLVLFNGTMVALFTVFVFRGLTAIIETGVLW